ncbi:MAG: 4-hydroxyphenylacetate 3-hydroxylase N-terminal domain-containing protein [Planctomycetota bacterium]|nr:4-hydroxyphenylacetate 3-hydroxylase N-terminal domain-containing protein [Planctomycetota bacterium]
MTPATMVPAPETAEPCAALRPFTGAEYRDSLDDGREVYLLGERVRDVASHPAFRNSVSSIASMYDALHDPAQRGTLTCPTEDGRGFTHRFFRVARSAADLDAARRAIDSWSRLSFGWMGRSPDYKASLTSVLGADPGWFGPFEASARAWYARSQRVPFLNHAIVNPPVDRHRPVQENRDVFIRAVRETSAGIVVRGAKVVATSAAITHANFVGQTPGTATDDPDMALAFITPISAPGTKIICRPSYELAASQLPAGDYPLSSRFDENDAIMVLDDVLVPWENVLIYRDPARVRGFFSQTGFQPNFLFHGCTRLAVKLEFIAALLARALKITGGDELRGNRALLGEVVAHAHTFDALARAMALSATPGPNGSVWPDKAAAMAYSIAAPEAYSRVRQIVLQTVASGLIYLPSSIKDLESPTLGPVLETYLRGSHGTGAQERTRVMKLLWDAVGTEFAGRHELYERNYAGAAENLKLQVIAEAERSPMMARAHAMVDRALAA